MSRAEATSRLVPQMQTPPDGDTLFGFEGAAGHRTRRSSSFDAGG
jgi:hypothetical protein